MELTPQDLKNIEDWYERTIGWQPPRVRFLAKYEPVTLKSWRAKWEGVFRGALPKQMMPYLSLRHNIVIGNPGRPQGGGAAGQSMGCHQLHHRQHDRSGRILLLRSRAHGYGRRSACGRPVTRRSFPCNRYHLQVFKASGRWRWLAQF